MTEHETAAANRPETSLTSGVLRAALLGVLAGSVFGVMIQFGLERMQVIGALYTLGEPSLSVGWVAHLAHSALFGAVYGLVVESRRLAALARRLPTGVALGAAFATALWGVNIVFLWPAWLDAVSVSMPPSLPYLAPMPLVGHLIYGGLLGGFVALAGR